MNRLIEIRDDRDLTQEDVSKILGIKRSTYSAYEIGACDINTKNLIKLALFYNLSIDYILYLTDERMPHKRNSKTNLENYESFKRNS